MYRLSRILILVLIMMVSTLVAVAATSNTPIQPKKSVARLNKSKPSAQPAKSKLKKAVQQKALPKLLDLGADKCVPCKMMFPVLDGLKKDYKGKLTVEFIDVWKNPSAKAKYKIRLIPTQIFYDSKGKEISRHEGYFPKEDILAEFKKHEIKL